MDGEARLAFTSVGGTCRVLSVYIEIPAAQFSRMEDMVSTLSVLMQAGISVLLSYWSDA